MTSDSFYSAFAAVFLVAAIGFALLGAWRKRKAANSSGGATPGS